MDDPVNPLIPSPTDPTYGLFASSPMYANSTHWANYMNALTTTLQGKSATAQGVNAYMTAVNAGHYRVIEWQNDMQLSQLKLIAANTAAIASNIETLNQTVAQNPGSIGDGTTITLTIPQELILSAKVGMFATVGTCALLLFMLVLKAIHARHPF